MKPALPHLPPASATLIILACLSITAILLPLANPCRCQAPGSREVKVLLVVYNPIVEHEDGRKLTEVFGWHDPYKLVEQFIKDIKECSWGLLNYKIVEQIELDAYPVRTDGSSYNDKTFIRYWKTKIGHQYSEMVSYRKIIQEFNIIDEIERGAIDEVWLMAFPGAGFWESSMAGRNAFFCNSEPVYGTEDCPRRFIIMGFNYERDVDCMLESFGHRVESIMKYVFRHQREGDNYWKEFILYDDIAPGQANCGNIHFAPNSDSKKNYDWGNRRYVRSNCDDWYNFPDFKGETKEVNCEEWGNGVMWLHHKWWLKHIPHALGMNNGISYNWWEYIADPTKVR